MKVECSIDLDGTDFGELSDLLNFLIKHKRLKEGCYRLSSSQTGYHISLSYDVPTFFMQIVDEESFKLGMRFALGDCLGRLKADVNRLEHKGETDRLFYRKNGKEAGDWVQFKQEVLNNEEEEPGQP